MALVDRTANGVDVECTLIGSVKHGEETLDSGNLLRGDVREPRSESDATDLSFAHSDVAHVQTGWLVSLGARFDNQALAAERGGEAR
ncbi:hypothetical protein MRBLWH7_002393 [Microbacterium sp. LWH7-1.2]|uniref:hypothetical protein n=1 Tax=Microbacterium sp. LWH7-1.2 TaxID=3135257 RepID=UPI00313887C7